MTNGKRSKQDCRTRLVGELHYLFHIGFSCVEAINELWSIAKSDREFGKHCSAINVLAAQAVEILPKYLIALRICLDQNDKSIEKVNKSINSRLKKLGHDICNIFADCEISDLRKSLGIIKIERFGVDTEFLIDEYRFHISNTGIEQIIRIKNLEGARYGLLARNPDTGGCSLSDMENTIQFVNKLKEEVIFIKVKSIQNFDSSNA